MTPVHGHLIPRFLHKNAPHEVGRAFPSEQCQSGMDCLQLNDLTKMPTKHKVFNEDSQIGSTLAADDFRDNPWKFNIAPENKPSQKESNLPTIIFQRRAVKLWEGGTLNIIKPTHPKRWLTTFFQAPVGSLNHWAGCQQPHIESSGALEAAKRNVSSHHVSCIFKVIYTSLVKNLEATNQLRFKKAEVGDIYIYILYSQDTSSKNLSNTLKANIPSVVCCRHGFPAGTGNSRV